MHCGYAIKTGGELVSVFSSTSGSGHAMVASAVANGAHHLDCFAERDEQGNLSGSLFTHIIQ